MRRTHRRVVRARRPFVALPSIGRAGAIGVLSPILRVGAIALLASIAMAGALATGSAAAEDALVAGPVPRLDPPALADPTGGDAGRASFRAEGEDPAGPRLLTLWLWDGDRFHRIAETRSDATHRRFDFGQQPLPLRGAAYHVAPRGRAPEMRNLLRVDRVLPAPRVLGDPIASGEIVIAPALHAGTLAVRDATSGRLLDRLVVDPAARRRVVLPLEPLARRVEAVTIEQQLDDGRRSRPTWLRLAR